MTAKNVGTPLVEGDELIFSVSRNGELKESGYVMELKYASTIDERFLSVVGEVTMKKNKEAQIQLFCVDSELDYWWLLDMVGSTTKIRAFTGVLVDSSRKY